MELRAAKDVVLQAYAAKGGPWDDPGACPCGQSSLVEDDRDSGDGQFSFAVIK